MQGVDKYDFSKIADAFLLYLPPYSPDLNPIELAFSKLKALLRKTAAKNVDDLWRTIADLIDEFTPQECQNSWLSKTSPRKARRGGAH